MSDFIRFKDFEEELAISPYLDLYPGELKVNVGASAPRKHLFQRLYGPPWF